MPTLHDWSVVCTSDQFTAPEFRAYRLIGFAYRSTKFRDGSHIRSNQLFQVNASNCESFKQGDQIMTQSGTTYTLGEPAERTFLTYEEWVASEPPPGFDPKRAERLNLSAA